MSLAESNLALGAVTDLITNRLNVFTKGTHVTATRPERARKKGPNPKLNVFLYETVFDASLRNFSLDPGRPAPLWLVLKYLLTAFDEDDDSDTSKAHALLGQGLSALQELAYLPIDSSLFPQALNKNPEPLKITFDEITADVISKLMQGSDEKYRLSVGFQVRPVMIAPPEPPSYSLLVGINYTKTPAEIKKDDESRFINVLPSLGINLEAVTPPSFELNSTISLMGSDLNAAGVEVFLGPSTLPIQPPITGSELKCQVSSPGLSAGSYPLFVRQPLAGGRFRSSNLLVGNLLPRLTTAIPANLVKTTDNVSGASTVSGVLDLAGDLLGTNTDDIVVAFYRNGAVERTFDEFDSASSSPPNRVTILPTQSLPPDFYRIIVRVNGQQARNSPTVKWDTP